MPSDTSSHPAWGTPVAAIAAPPLVPPAAPSPAAPAAGPEDSAAQRGAHETRAILESVHDLRTLLADARPIALAPGHEIIACSRPMRELLEQADQVANTKATVLIEGESGTGKELLARLVHCRSARAHGSFVRVNCAALSESLVESELFGHEKGAFTGATEQRAGRFELADGGTLLLDEIGEMSVKLQAKLLRVLEEEEFERVGGTRSLHCDVRVIATTNRELEREIAQGGFRKDLFYRLSVVRFRMAPLRARKEDILPLVDHFIGQYGHESRGQVRAISPRALDILLAHDWPGNVRQLRNTVHRACILARKEQIEPHDLPPLESVAVPPQHAGGKTLEEIERCVILEALRATGGNKTAAAQRLGVTSRTLFNKLQRYRTQGLLGPSGSV